MSKGKADLSLYYYLRLENSKSVRNISNFVGSDESKVRILLSLKPKERSELPIISNLNEWDKGINGFGL